MNQIILIKLLHRKEELEEELIESAYHIEEHSIIQGKIEMINEIIEMITKL